MATTRDEIREWLERAKEENATHMVVVCDQFDWEDYPVFVSKEENVKEIVNKYNDSSKMSRVMEVYDMSKDIEAQLSSGRVYNL